MSLICVKFNDNELEIEGNSSLEELLQSRKFKSDKLIIEFNHNLLASRAEAKDIKLSNGDIINVFSLVAGG